MFFAQINSWCAAVYGNCNIVLTLVRQCGRISIDFRQKTVYSNKWNIYETKFAGKRSYDPPKE